MRELKKTFITFILYLFLPLVLVLGLKFLFNIEYSSSNITHIVWLNIGVDSLFFILFIIINKDVLLKNKPMKGNSKKEKIINYIVTVLIVTLLFYVVKIFFSIVASIISFIFGLKQISTNQEILELTFKSAPILMTISGVILAPVVEEIVFRGTVRKVIKNKWVFVIVSGLLFGLVHVLRYDLPIFVVLISGILLDIIITSTLNKNKKIGLSLCTILVMTIVLLLGLQVVSGDLINLILTIQMSEVVNSIVYIAAGVFLALVYAKYDNIYVTIGCHMINNLLAYILLFTM